ncbi:unnamed protein product, partial [Musa hybrid cultivar]
MLGKHGGLGGLKTCNEGIGFTETFALSLPSSSSSPWIDLDGGPSYGLPLPLRPKASLQHSLILLAVGDLRPCRLESLSRRGRRTAGMLDSRLLRPSASTGRVREPVRGATAVLVLLPQRTRAWWRASRRRTATASDSSTTRSCSRRCR